MRRDSILHLLAVAALVVGQACSEAPAAARDRFLRNGDRYIAAKHLVEAEIEYRNAVQRDPRSVEAQRKLGEVYIALNQPVKALEAFLRAIELDRSSVPTHLKAGSLFLLGGNNERAASAARDALAIDPRNLEGHILLANALAGMRDVAEATRQLEEAIAMNPSDAAGYAALGELQWSASDRPSAEASFRKAVEIDPDSVRAHLSLGEYCWRIGHVKEAETELQRAASLGADDRLANTALAEFYMATGKGAAAEPYWQRVAAVAPDPSGTIALANYYLWIKRPSDAIDTVRPLIGGPDPTGDITSQIAAVLYEGGDTAGGARLVDQEIARNRSNPRALLVKARMLIRQQQWNAAADYAAKAVAYAPESWAAHEALGRCQAHLDRLDEAIASFKEAVRVNPVILGLRVELAAAFAAAGRGRDAMVVLDRAFPNQPARAAAAANDVAWRTAKSGHDLESALSLAKVAVQRLPARAEPYDTLGTIYLKTGAIDQAVAAFERSLRISPGDATYRAHLAEARSTAAAQASAK